MATALAMVTVEWHQAMDMATVMAMALDLAMATIRVVWHQVLAMTLVMVVWHQVLTMALVMVVWHQVLVMALVMVVWHQVLVMTSVMVLALVQEVNSQLSFQGALVQEGETQLSFRRMGNNLWSWLKNNMNNLWS